MDRTPEVDRARLTSQVAILPGVDFDENSFGAVLAARVLHFLTGPQIEESVGKIAKWLKPGGKAFLITDTIYSGFWKSHAPIYEKLKAEGHPWPGEIKDAHLYLPEPARYKTSMRYMNLLDPEIFRRVCEGAGLEVERVGYVSPGSHEKGKAYGASDNDRTGVIAVKV